jgi:hypothetical protein
MQLFIPAAERDAPPWACRFAKVQGGFMVFDNEDALWVWKDSVRSKPRARPRPRPPRPSVWRSLAALIVNASRRLKSAVRL